MRLRMDDILKKMVWSLLCLPQVGKPVFVVRQ